MEKYPKFEPNTKINKKKNSVFIFVNPKIYPLDVIYSAAYVFLDKTYILLDGNPKEKIMIELKPKEKYDLEKLAREFCNELLNYAFYKEQAVRNAPLREKIIQRALITSELSTEQPILKELKEEKIPEFEATDADWREDPKGIAIPWEKKYDRKAKNKSKKNKK